MPYYSFEQVGFATFRFSFLLSGKINNCQFDLKMALDRKMLSRANVTVSGKTFLYATAINQL